MKNKRAIKYSDNNIRYRLLTLDRSSKSYQIECDYYIPAVIRHGSWNKGSRFELLIENNKIHTRLFGIIIVDENIRTIIENVDWNSYKCCGVAGFHLTKQQIHNGISNAK